MFSDAMMCNANCEQSNECTVGHVRPAEVPDLSVSRNDKLKRGARKSYKRRVVCKARGLSKKHNADTAYFEIPANAPHGLLLSCSHPECMASGRKFRYCEVCALPVAKRNFLLRHGHGLFQTSKELKEEVDEIADSLLEGLGPPGGDLLVGDESNRKQPHHRRVVSFEGRRRILNENQLDDVELMWLKLLHQRPSAEDQPKMAEWMEKIISLSEKKRVELMLSDESIKPAIAVTTPTPDTKQASSAEVRLNLSQSCKQGPGTLKHVAEAPLSVEVSGYASLFEEVDIENLFNFEPSHDYFGHGIEATNE